MLQHTPHLWAWESRHSAESVGEDGLPLLYEAGNPGGHIGTSSENSGRYQVPNELNEANTSEPPDRPCNGKLIGTMLFANFPTAL